MIVRVGLLDKSDNYISRLANYQNVHSNEAVQFEIYLFTEEHTEHRMPIGISGRRYLFGVESTVVNEREQLIFGHIKLF